MALEPEPDREEILRIKLDLNLEAGERAEAEQKTAAPAGS